MTRKLFFLSSFLIILISCQKRVDTFTENKAGEKPFDYNRFFPESAPANPVIKRIFEYLKSENGTQEFLPAFVTIAGYPRWDKIILKDDRYSIIPLVSDNNTTMTGILVAEFINDQVKCHYSLLTDYRKMGEFKKEFVFGMIELENFVFGRTSFKIYDHSVLGTANTIYLKKAQRQQSQTANSYDDPCGIVEIWFDPTEEECHCSGDEYYTGRWYYEGNCFDITSTYVLPRDDGSYITLPFLGGSGGSNPPPYVSTFTERLNYLLNQLDMTPESSEFLPTSEATVNEMYNYLYNDNSDDAKEIATDHIQRMSVDADYLSFVQAYRSSTGYVITPWWENQTWLSDPTNFHFDNTEENNQRDRLTAAEKILIAAYPVQAYVIHKNVAIARGTASATGLTGVVNGKQDAFRHAFFQAINVRDVPHRFTGQGLIMSVEIVSMFALAHESEVPLGLRLELQMDMFNNNVGIVYGLSSYQSSNSTIVNAIMTKVNNGELKYISPLSFSTSGLHDWNQDGIQDCPTCWNGIIAASVLIPTNQ
jgi:hypothetical protein